MEILENKQSCCGCHACYNACPVHAIVMQANDEGFLEPVVDEDKCIQCNKCQSVCPVLHPPKNETMEKAYICYAADKKERISSSSGGVFAVLARSILQEGGIVCGAAYDNDFSVNHVLIEKTEDLYAVKGTKYVQSSIGDAYSLIRNYLREGRTVLFSGTPCQAAGLKSYLGKPYEKLVCIDLICHGVPSPAIWKRYLEEIAEGKQLISVNFREKDAKTGVQRLTYSFSDGTKKVEEKAESLYMKGFIQNYFLRESCFDCKFKGAKRCSDLTIGDFWSAKELHPEYEDGFGTSAVIVHSEKGQTLLQNVQSQLVQGDAKVDEIACWNDCLLVPTKKTLKKAIFYERIQAEELTSVIKDLIAQTEQANKKREASSLISRAKAIINRLRR